MLFKKCMATNYTESFFAYCVQQTIYEYLNEDQCQTIKRPDATLCWYIERGKSYNLYLCWTDKNYIVR